MHGKYSNIAERESRGLGFGRRVVTLGLVHLLVVMPVRHAAGWRTTSSTAFPCVEFLVAGRVEASRFVAGEAGRSSNVRLRASFPNWLFGFPCWAFRLDRLWFVHCACAGEIVGRTASRCVVALCHCL